MDDVLVIQNSSAEGLGSLEDLLVNDGFRLQNVFAKKEKIPQNDYSLLVVLGAPESANDNLDYLKNEMTLIQQFVKKEKPVLGICLGSQLIAKSFGAKVFRGARTEIGFYHDLHIENTSKLFSGFENPFTVFSLAWRYIFSSTKCNTACFINRLCKSGISIRNCCRDSISY